LIDKVQNEYYLDKYLSGATKWNKKEIDKAVEDHDTLKQELFQHLNNNIEKWWD
jgi:hypothetical protein